MPARIIPAPTHVSGELQAWIRSAARARNEPVAVPKSEEEWRRQVHEKIVGLARQYAVTITPETMAGVRTHVIVPLGEGWKHRDQIMVHVHGGAYVAFGGEAGIDEAILLAHHTGLKVVAADYRMPPDHPFPAAVEDSIAVWKQLTREFRPSNVAVGGSSAGGGLALAIVLKLKEVRAPLPGAIFAGTPWADLTNGGDSNRTNDGVDAALSGANDFLLASGKLYAGREDVRNPLISPIYGDFSGFPPTILLSGTRDILLSDTARVHRKLRNAGNVAELHVFEAMSHGDYAVVPSAPESKEAYQEVAQFFAQHLGKHER